MFVFSQEVTIGLLWSTPLFQHCILPNERTKCPLGKYNLCYTCVFTITEGMFDTGFPLNCATSPNKKEASAWQHTSEESTLEEDSRPGEIS